MMVLSLTGRCRQAPHLVRVIVSAAWVTLLYVASCLSPLELGHYFGTNEGRTRWPGSVILTKIY